MGREASLLMRVVCRRVSNALLKSRAKQWTKGQELVREERVVRSEIRADVVDPDGLKANWSERSFWKGCIARVG
jgi:hypothetical protein